MDTNLPQAAKKSVSVNVLYLDDTGYGPQGVLTRRAWRKECLSNLLKGADAFNAWQNSWQNLIKDDLDDKSFGCKLTTSSDSDLAEVYLENGPWDCKSPYSLDFVGCHFKYEVNLTEFEFKPTTIFIASSFDKTVNFSHSQFHGDLYFNESYFNDDAYFTSTIFDGNIYFGNIQFNGNTYFGEANLNSDAYFVGTTFSSDAHFYNVKISVYGDFKSTIFGGITNFHSASFLGCADFYDSKYCGDTVFENAKFGDDANFKRSTFGMNVTFKKAIFSSKASFITTTFARDALFISSTFGGDVFFTGATFEGEADFSLVTFNNKCRFDIEFDKLTHEEWIKETTFAKSADFENASFKNVGHFERVRFLGEIPSFLGVDNACTRLEFSGDEYFSKSDVSEDAVKRLGLLKRLSDEHGQTDQALMFNAFELRAKAKQPNAGSILKITTNLYEKLSDYGRSFAKPIFWYGALICLSALFAMIYSTYSDSSSEDQQVLCKPIKDQPPPLKLTYGRAVVEYAMFRAGGLMDFTDTGKQNNAVNCRLFEEPIEPPLMRAWGIFKGIASIALLFLAALGLRNKYRIK